MKAFVIFRDRVTYAKQCVDALYTGGIDDVIVLDQGSTYEPAIDWLRLDLDIKTEQTPNFHPQNLLNTDWIEYHVGVHQRYVVTDCDVVPHPDCPGDWLEYLSRILDRFPDRTKVGLGLSIDDLPDHYQYRWQVVAWEQQHWNHPINSGLYGAAIDTTLAVWQPLEVQPNFSLGPAVRTGYPYLAKHLPWYEDSSNLSEEQVYYEAHMNKDYSHWINPERYG